MTDPQRLQHRPSLNLAPATAPGESFQNETLRPIAKQQNDLLAQIFRMFLLKRKVNVQQTAQLQRFEKVKELVARDNRLRGLLFGIIIGQFTSDEIQYYAANEGDVNRRLTNLLTERLLDTVR